MLADLVVFTSAPVIWDWVYNVFHAAVYSKTGRSLFGDLQLPTDGGWIPENIPALQAGNCASCFVCKVSAAATCRLCRRATWSACVFRLRSSDWSPSSS